MSFRGSVERNWRLTKILAPLPAILPLLSACYGIFGIPDIRELSRSASESSEAAGVYRYNDALFVLELKNVETFDNEIKMTFMYTNRTGGEQYARPQAPRARAYLVDNLGNRYPYVGDSIGRPQWPPQIPVELWITFAKEKAGASYVNLVLPWYAQETGSRVVAPRGGGESEPTIMFRRIPLPAAPAAAPGFRYSHQLFMLELKSVEVVDDEVRINLTYTNRTSSPQFASVAAGNAYLVDNLGKRYTYSSDSFSRTRRNFPPQAAEEIWISFGKLQPGSSSVNLILPWRPGGAGPVNITFRGIPLPQ